MSNNLSIFSEIQSTTDCVVFDKQKTCCFTGHRSQKLPWGFKKEDEQLSRVKQEVRNLIEDAIARGYKVFISGMALGFDTICAEIVLDLKSRFDIKLVLAIPCKNQAKFWREGEIEHYQDLLSKADDVIYLSDDYTKSCMEKRNKFMVSSSSLCIALYAGKEGGTKKTLDYAEKAGIEIKTIIIN